MVAVNVNYLKLAEAYLFPEINCRVEAFLKSKPEAKDKLIRCGIGDVTEPLIPAIIIALQEATEKLSHRETFRGYGPEQGYLFLREAIVENAYKGLGISAEEIFISDGSKCDVANILDILESNLKIAVSDPVYPVYVDTNVMAGNTGEMIEGNYAGIQYLSCVEENGFIPEPNEKEKVDIIYLCSPNNPTGVVATQENLKKWIKYAKKNEALILFDSAYEAFITDSNLPHSIYEIDGAKECAIEFRSFSKHGGLTGLRCGYVVIPQQIKGKAKRGKEKGKEISLHQLWSRRQTTKFNGASYLSQCGAFALFSEQGKKEAKERITYYLDNAKLLKQACEKVGFSSFGGDNAPYIWAKYPQNFKSWSFFDFLLQEQQIVCTPGIGFGKNGEGYFRLSAFNSRENIEEVAQRFLNIKY